MPDWSLPHTPVGTCLIRPEVFAALGKEARDKHPKESGGSLFGIAKDDVIYIATAIGPGPKAKHERFSFEPDYDFCDAAIDKLWESSSQVELQYLGDWHSHPGGFATLSDLDVNAMRKIRSHEPARCPNPITLIVTDAFAQDYGSSMSSGVFQMEDENNIVRRTLYKSVTPGLNEKFPAYIGSLEDLS